MLSEEGDFILSLKKYAWDSRAVEMKTFYLIQENLS